MHSNIDKNSEEFKDLQNQFSGKSFIKKWGGLF